MSVDYRPDYDPADVDSDYGHTGGDITVPTFTANMKPFRFWCQKALPLVYDDSLSYYEVLCKVVKQMNDFLTDLQTATGAIDQFAQQFVINQQFLNDMADQLGQNVQDLEDYINDRLEDYMTAYTQLQNYVNNYFDNLDVQQEINNKLDDMASDGTLNDLFDPVLETWMQQKTAQIDFAISEQDAIQAAQNSRISVLESRMNTFEGLPAGSTSGNAELLGIRTNFLGEVYPTAGDAVRSSDMIASGFDSIPFTRLEEWNGNEAATVYDTLQIDVSAYKGGRVIMIANMEGFESAVEGIGVAVYGTDVSGKTADQNAHAYILRSNVFVNYSVIPTDISGEERIALYFNIPEDFSYQYLKMGFVEPIPVEEHTEPESIVYATSWSKTPVDPTLTQAGEAADAKATGDALSELNGQLDSTNLLLEDETSTRISEDNTLANAIAAEKERAEAEESRIEALFSEPTQEAINNWLNDHPEATTTVQDNSLTFKKLVNGTLGFVMPQMFGAKGDGYTDDTIAFTAMIEVMSENSIEEIHIPAGTYILSDSILIPFDCRIIGDNAALIFDKNRGIKISGKYSLVGATSEVINAHSTSIPITIPYSRDKEYIIYNPVDGSWNNRKAYYRQGEFLDIKEYTNGNIILCKPLDDTYPAGCEIYALETITAHVEGINLKYGSANTESSSALLSIKNGKDSTIENCTFIGGNTYQLELNNCIRTRVNNCNGYSKANNIALNYGISILSCQNIKVENCSFNTRRHGFTIGNGTIAIVSRYIEYKNCFSCAIDHVAGVGGFDSHSNAEFVKWHSCKGDAISDQASNSIIDNCEFISSANYNVYINGITRGKTSIINTILRGANSSNDVAILYSPTQDQTGITNTFELILKDCTIYHKLSFSGAESIKLLSSTIMGDIEVQYGKNPLIAENCIFNGTIKYWRSRNSGINILRKCQCNKNIDFRGDAGQNAFISIILDGNIFTYNPIDTTMMISAENCKNIHFINNNAKINISANYGNTVYFKNISDVIDTGNIIDMVTNSHTSGNIIGINNVTNHVNANNILLKDGVVQS